MTEFIIDSEQFDQMILQRLPTIMRQNSQIQELVLELARQNFSDRKETDDRFYQLLEELKRDREEQSRKWQEQNIEWKAYTQEQNQKWKAYTQEQNQKWEEQNRKWEEQNQKWKAYTQEQNQKWEEQNGRLEKLDSRLEKTILVFEEKLEKAINTLEDKLEKAIKALEQKQDRSITALGAHWGLKSESSFRNALVGILEKSFGVQVLNITDYDDKGEVFGRPDQIELDVIIKNGLLIICEIKSSMSRSDVYTFERKVRFYEKHHQRQANRILVISPMVDAKAQKVAEQLGVEVYSDSMEVKSL